MIPARHFSRPLLCLVITTNPIHQSKHSNHSPPCSQLRRHYQSSSGARTRHLSNNSQRSSPMGSLLSPRDAQHLLWKEIEHPSCMPEKPTLLISRSKASCVLWFKSERPFFKKI